MGHGNWDRTSFERYNKSRGRAVDTAGRVKGNYSNQDMFKARKVDPALDPKNVMRECCDSEDHPATIPVILALDVTGSMGQAAVEVAKELNVIMTKLYDKIRDVEFMVMGIGDLACDTAPIQISQFEADIRIADQLEKIFFEFGGGGNAYESYTAAWYMAARHTKLDCWKRGKRGILITMGDEPLNPYLPLRGSRTGLGEVTGDCLQADVETGALYEECLPLYDIYHLNVEHRARIDERIEPSFRKYLDEKHYRNVSLSNIADVIVEIITKAQAADQADAPLVGWKTEAPAEAVLQPAAPATKQENEPKPAPGGILGGILKAISW